MSYKFPDNIYFVPIDEYDQWQMENEKIKNGGYFDLTGNLIVKDAKKAAKLYAKAKKLVDQRKHAFKQFQEAAKLGHANAKVWLAYYYTGKDGVEKDVKLSQKYANEAIAQDSMVWNIASKYVSSDGETYVKWARGDKKDFPFKFLYQYKGKEAAEKIMREEADKGVQSAQEILAKELWYGKNIDQNKREATKWMKILAPNNKEMQDYLIVARGEGIYDEDIPDEWYLVDETTFLARQHSQFVVDAANNGNQDAKLAIAGRAGLKKEVENGNHSEFSFFL